MDGYSLVAKMKKHRRRFRLTATEQALYHELVGICNEDGWEVIFSASNEELYLALSISEKTLDKARQNLINAGLIYYKSGKSRRVVGLYSFTKPFKEKKETVVNYTTDSTTNCSTDSTTNCSDLYKTKTKTKTIPPIIPQGEEVLFDIVWEMYGKKGNRKTSERRWSKLKNNCRESALKHIPLYVRSTPDKQYRKNFETYLNQEVWNDEVIESLAHTDDSFIDSLMK